MRSQLSKATLSNATAMELLKLPPREAQWELYLLGFGDEPGYDVDPISDSLRSDAIH
jgi:hypothetical protein